VGSRGGGCILRQPRHESSPERGCRMTTYVSEYGILMNATATGIQIYKSREE